MKYILTLITLLYLQICSAQNYNCLQYGPQRFFINSDGYVRAMRIDSVRAIGADTIYYPFHSPRGKYCSGTMLTESGSWLGKDVIRKADGTFLFDNLWLDTVVVKTQAHTGDSWVFYNDTSQMYYTATVTAEDTMTVLGGIDSIKRVTITAYDTGVINTADSVNGFTFILSKNNGFVEVFDLFTFPYHVSGSIPHYRDYIDYYLDMSLGIMPDVDCLSSAGITEQPGRKLSRFKLFPFHNPTQMEVYDFAEGDVYEYYNSFSNIPYYETIVRLDSIVSKVVSAYSVTYTIAWKSKKDAINYMSPPTITTYASGTYTVSKDTTRLLNLNKLPEEWKARYYYYYNPPSMTSARCIPDALYELHGEHFRYQDDTAAFYTRERDIMDSYGLGYGQMSRSEYYSAGPGTSKGYYMNYARKNGIVCGGYFDASVDDASLPDNGILNISPNPALTQLHLSASYQITDVAIVNLVGQTVFSADYASSDVVLPVDALPSGMYILKVNNLVTRKFVKQ